MDQRLGSAHQTCSFSSQLVLTRCKDQCEIFSRPQMASYQPYERLRLSVIVDMLQPAMRYLSCSRFLPPTTLFNELRADIMPSFQVGLDLPPTSIFHSSTPCPDCRRHFSHQIHSPQSAWTYLWCPLLFTRCAPVSNPRTFHNVAQIQSTNSTTITPFKHRMSLREGRKYSVFDSSKGNVDQLHCWCLRRCSFKPQLRPSSCHQFDKRLSSATICGRKSCESPRQLICPQTTLPAPHQQGFAILG